MGTVVIDLVMSLDGFIAGPSNQDDGLHDWYFEPTGNATLVIDELLQTIGAMIIGKGVYGSEPDGFETPYNMISESALCIAGRFGGASAPPRTNSMHSFLQEII